LPERVRLPHRQALLHPVGAFRTAAFFCRQDAKVAKGRQEFFVGATIGRRESVRVPFPHTTIALPIRQSPFGAPWRTWRLGGFRKNGAVRLMLSVLREGLPA
jgi:hypothetical protein